MYEYKGMLENVGVCCSMWEYGKIFFTFTSFYDIITSSYSCNNLIF